MPSLQNLQKAMVKQGVSPVIMAQMDFDATGCDAVFAVIEKMDELMTESQRYEVIEQLGCCKTGQRDRDCKAFAKLHKDKPLTEKLDLIKNVQHMADNRLNDDGTLSLFMGCIGMKEIAGCSCGDMKKRAKPASITYCGCCGGHFRYHYQNALGIKLKLIRIMAGEFVYEIAG